MRDVIIAPFGDDCDNYWLADSAGIAAIYLLRDEMRRRGIDIACGPMDEQARVTIYPEGVPNDAPWGHTIHWILGPTCGHPGTDRWYFLPCMGTPNVAVPLIDEGIFYNDGRPHEGVLYVEDIHPHTPKNELAELFRSREVLVHNHPWFSNMGMEAQLCGCRVEYVDGHQEMPVSAWRIWQALIPGQLDNFAEHLRALLLTSA